MRALTTAFLATAFLGLAACGDDISNDNGGNGNTPDANSGSDANTTDGSTPDGATVDASTQDGATPDGGTSMLSWTMAPPSAAFDTIHGEFAINTTDTINVAELRACQGEAVQGCGLGNQSFDVSAVATETNGVYAADLDMSGQELVNWTVVGYAKIKNNEYVTPAVTVQLTPPG